MSCTKREFSKPFVQAFVSRGIPDIKRAMEEQGAEVLVVTGTSGMAWAALLAFHGITVIQVRKDDDMRHHGSTVELDFDTMYERVMIKTEPVKALFFDDLIASGGTFSHVQDKLRNTSIEFVGVFLYDGLQYPEMKLYPNRDKRLANYAYRS